MKNILIADDEPHLIRIIKLGLERAGYKVDTAKNGEEAYESISQQQPDALITDIKMPRMSGEELCKKIEAEISERSFLIIVATSRTEQEHRDWTNSISNLIFIEKPISMRALLPMLEKFFNQQGGSR